jgi:hypothetical protein
MAVAVVPAAIISVAGLVVLVAVLLEKAMEQHRLQPVLIPAVVQAQQQAQLRAMVVLELWFCVIQILERLPSVQD